MQIREEQRAQFRDEGFTLAPGYLSKANGVTKELPSQRALSRELMAPLSCADANAMPSCTGDDPRDQIELTVGSLVAFSSLSSHRSGAITSVGPWRNYVVAYTPTLFTHSESEKGLYSSGDILPITGTIQSSAA